MHSITHTHTYLHTHTHTQNHNHMELYTWQHGLSPKCTCCKNRKEAFWPIKLPSNTLTDQRQNRQQPPCGYYWFYHPSAANAWTTTPPPRFLLMSIDKKLHSHTHIHVLCTRAIVYCMTCFSSCPVKNIY